MTPVRLTGLLFAVGLSAVSEPAAGQPLPGGADRADPEIRRAEAVQVTAGSVVVDGNLDDGAWEAARWITDFVQKDPVEGAPATVSTEV
ncbi:MAG TPA: hypothetical protein VJP59_05695, partial [Gemmatimonadota bacterium]|nr:hypothetical protein [Gemmatimonadota bacterium]